MKITIESTDIITELDGVPVRLWRGTTEQGHAIDVYAHRLGAEGPAADELAAALREMPPPRRITPREIEAIDWRLLV